MDLIGKFMNDSIFMDAGIFKTKAAFIIYHQKNLDLVLTFKDSMEIAKAGTHISEYRYHLVIIPRDLPKYDLNQIQYDIQYTSENFRKIYG